MTTGFVSKPKTGKDLSCVSCGLYKDCTSPRMVPYGNFKRGIMNVGEAPGQYEDEAGKPWQGKMGKVLQQAYKELKIDLFEDCININAVRCRPMDNRGANRAPKNTEINCCRQYLLRNIQKYQPKVIILLGNAALVSVIGNRWKRDLGTITKWRGWTIPDREYNAWVCPTFHPSYVERAVEDGSFEVATVWKQDLQRAVSLTDVQLPVYVEPTIEVITDLSRLSLIHTDQVAFDYETTGLKPHAEGHRIVCVSVADSPDHSIVFMMPPTRAERRPFTDLLGNVEIGKMAHNIKYENSWSNVRLRQSVKNWLWDSMLAAHVLDNRRGITSLKFQTYVNFGVADYSSEIDPYLKPKGKGNGNSFNQIETLLALPNGQEKLLHYCALDAIYEYRLAMLQRDEVIFKKPKMTGKINPRSHPAYVLLQNGILALARAEQAGIRVDVEYTERKKESLLRKIEHVKKQFKHSDFFKRWQDSSEDEVNPDSHVQLSNFLYNVEQYTPAKLTAKGAGSTDKEALQQLNITELNALLETKKLKKLWDVLNGFSQEQVNGYIHPFFSLNNVVSFRSSSDSPNFQNIPKRDEESMRLVRQALYPRPGHQLLEVDYSGLEVHIAACYHKDPTMLRYINDPTTDMHTDMAKQIFMLDDYDKEIHKTLRSATKNGFVFPEFYGDYYKNCAKSLACNWGKLPQGKWSKGEGIPLGDTFLADHLIGKGIGSLDKFTKHIQKIEANFWERRFPHYAEWKRRWWTLYQKYGYIDLYTGFRCSGVMGRNDCINYPVQGAAFHCLLWSFIEIDRLMQAEGWDTRILGQIHDAIVLDVNPTELEYVTKVIHRVTCEDLPKAWPWIIVPLEVEMEVCPVDGSWADKIKYKPE